MNFIQGNWVDLLIVAVLIYFVSEAWRVGFWVIFADFLGFLLSLVVALFGYSLAAQLLRDNFSLSHSVANALGFLLTAGLSEAVFGFIFATFIKKIPYKFWKKPWNNIAATFPAAGQGLVLVAFILTLVFSLPVSPKFKDDIGNSKIGGFLVGKTSGLDSRLNDVFGGLVKDSLTYLTIKPDSREIIPISVDKQELTVDEVAEKTMFNLVNDERKKQGIKELTWREEVLPVARGHGQDMWERQYFGHVSPDGEDVTDRMAKEEISYSVVGENLALAPTVITAHNGLMNSEGHRRNILDPDFRRVAIGVIDNGIYGKMFVQVFTD